MWQSEQEFILYLFRMQRFVDETCHAWNREDPTIKQFVKIHIESVEFLEILVSSMDKTACEVLECRANILPLLSPLDVLEKFSTVTH